jgi:hypothetical protein
MQVAEKIVDALLEGEMPDWLKKKISGKAEKEDGEGGGESKDDGDDDEGGEKKPKKSSDSSSTSADVAGALGKIGH